MKFGIRKPSIKKRITSRTSVKRHVRHSLGVKVPKGGGYITNPKKALYNDIYRKTTVSISDSKNSSVGGFVVFFIIIFVIFVLFNVFLY